MAINWFAGQCFVPWVGCWLRKVQEQSANNNNKHGQLTTDQQPEYKLFLNRTSGASFLRPENSWILFRLVVCWRDYAGCLVSGWVKVVGLVNRIPIQLYCSIVWQWPSYPPPTFPIYTKKDEAPLIQFRQGIFFTTLGFYDNLFMTPNMTAKCSTAAAAARDKTRQSFCIEISSRSFATCGIIFLLQIHCPVVFVDEISASKSISIDF